MITVFSRFPLPPGLSREEILADVRSTIGWYRDRPGCLRKYVCIDWEAGVGQGVYLWDDRELAEAFYAEAASEIERQTGARPQFTFLDTPVVVDNVSGEVIVEGQRVDHP